MTGTINIFDVLRKIYGPLGLPFPNPPSESNPSPIAGSFTAETVQGSDRSELGTAIRKYDDSLGRWTFLPASIDGYDLENPLVIISGEKEIQETDVVDVGTVFEKVFTRPYDISIICTLIGEDGNWPDGKLRDMVDIWKKDDVVTLRCALTDFFLQPKNNLVITKIAILDAQGAENVEVIQIDGRSNIDFELEIK